MNITLASAQENSRITHVDIRIDVITFRALQKTLSGDFNYTALEAQAINDFSILIDSFKVPHLFVT